MLRRPRGHISLELTGSRESPYVGAGNSSPARATHILTATSPLQAPVDNF